MIILEMQDGMMCRNDTEVVKRMIDGIAANIPPTQHVVLKWQLYTAIDNGLKMIPLNHSVFEYAIYYAKKNGFETTASVFDRESHKYLERFFPPFIKIACQTDLYDFRKNIRGLIKKNKKYVVSSYEPMKDTAYIKYLFCVPKYPATMQEYEKIFPYEYLKSGISDHTIGLDLYKKYRPEVYEKHFYMEGLDSYDKEWAVRPEQLKEIL